jgi:hypothetical protein
MLGLASLAVAFFERDATLYRRAAGTWALGVYAAGAETTTAIKAVVQAPSQNDLRTAPEGERTDGWVTIWSRTELRTTSEPDELGADEIETIGGNRYRVIRVGNRAEGGFWRCIGRKIDDRSRTV